MIFIPTLFKTEPVKKPININGFYWLWRSPALLLFAMALGDSIELHLPQWLPRLYGLSKYFLCLSC